MCFFGLFFIDCSDEYNLLTNAGQLWSHLEHCNSMQTMLHNCFNLFGHLVSRNFPSLFMLQHNKKNSQYFNINSISLNNSQISPHANKLHIFNQVKPKEMVL